MVPSALTVPAEQARHICITLFVITWPLKVLHSSAVAGWKWLLRYFGTVEQCTKHSRKMCHKIPTTKEPPKNNDKFTKNDYIEAARQQLVEDIFGVYLGDFNKMSKKSNFGSCELVR